MFQYKISVVVESNDPEAKDYLFESWNDIRIKPLFRGMERYIHFIFFNTIEELESIVSILIERLSIKKDKLKEMGLDDDNVVEYDISFLEAKREEIIINAKKLMANNAKTKRRETNITIRENWREIIDA